MGFQLLGERYYDPEIGRFLSPDPIGFAGGLNLYGYCQNDAINAVDPEGECLNYIVGAASGVATGYVISRITGTKYGWHEALWDAGTGALGVGLASKFSKILQARKAARLFFHGESAFNPALIEDGARHWATPFKDVGKGASRIGGNIRLVPKWPFWEKKILIPSPIPSEIAAKYVPAYSKNVFSWWKGAQGQYYYQAPGPRAMLRDAFESLGTASGFSGILKGGRWAVGVHPDGL